MIIRYNYIYFLICFSKMFSSTFVHLREFGGSNLEN